MKTRSAILLPVAEQHLKDFGLRIKQARLRRHISVQLMAERTGVSRATIWAIEKGSPTVAMGKYVQVLASLGFIKDLASVARDDRLGQSLQDLKLPLRERAPKRMIGKQVTYDKE